ncbi:glycoside hydrolase family 3 N-terminal domain-containing protein [Mucilaginibacter pedocola]|uniref:Fibronectin type III-like domain-containing protein n=1 Tax=Mucilaginibacter pedocola TaxID=1792845 RepID=A0A1S9PA47_9SPHI|nr:glycoside hydrolase family 3 N-terminal domain-containing protein [Mucilaginibacter pedocola]OOQ57850.1 hypothetical protein BC343_13820 [Mucilaginibacter pedocola]
MNKLSRKITLILSLSVSISFSLNAQVYKDPKKSIEERVSDLLGRMTLEEKIAQMSMTSLSGSLKSPISVGVVESPFITAGEITVQSAAAKKYAREKTRLGIPPIQIGECLHGQLAAGATIFPQAIGQGSTWNPSLIRKMAGTIASEASASGVDQALSPLFDLIRDPRYGRVEECLGEDPYLVSQLGCAFVNGMQGEASESRIGIPEGKLIATGKHFAAYSIPVAGVNIAPAKIGERELRSMFLSPFRDAVQKANIYSIMPSYNETDGIPAHSSKFILKQILREEWNFGGYVFSDYGGLSQLYDFHKIAKTKADAAMLGMEAGVDLEASRPDIYKTLPELVKNGSLRESVIDSAVARILRIKFKAGLFEKNLPDTISLKKKLHTAEAVALSQQIAEESIVLLKNQGNVLPLNISSLHSIAVIGPNADKVQYGDYSSTRDNRSGTTVLKGIREYVGDKVKVNYALGCELSGPDTSKFAEAEEAARRSDAVVVVLGTTSVVFEGIGWNGKAGKDEPSDPFSCGEGYDVTDIDPQGVQRKLLQRLYQAGKPVILVLVHGRPWSISWEKEHVPAILEAWYPGERGGNAVANILFGKVNPSGRLNMTIPQSTGHIPVYYNYVNSSKGNNRQPGSFEKPGRDYVYSSTAPLFPFGFGLSYTTFSYADLKVSSDTLSGGKEIEVRLSVTNNGKVKGKEVVQLYLGNKVNSVSTPEKQLKRFSKIEVAPGKTQIVRFTIKAEDLAFWNRDMKEATEPGEFDLMIGRSAEDIVLKKKMYLD